MVRKTGSGDGRAGCGTLERPVGAPAHGRGAHLAARVGLEVAWLESESWCGTVGASLLLVDEIARPEGGAGVIEAIAAERGLMQAARTRLGVVAAVDSGDPGPCPS